MLGDVNFQLASFELAVHLILRKFVAAQNRVCRQECHHEQGPARQHFGGCLLTKSLKGTMFSFTSKIRLALLASAHFVDMFLNT